jgi:hypothetical protein
MKRTSILLAPALAIFLAGCGRTDEARREAPGAGETAAQPAPEQGGERAQAPPAAEQPARQTERAARPEPERERPVTRSTGAETRSRAAEQRRSEVDVPAGAVLRVRLDQALDTETNKGGDKFTATLAEPVVVDGRTVIPKGTRFNGTVTTSESSGRLSGKGVLTVKLDSFRLNGREYDIASTAATRITEGHKKRDIGIIGGGAAAGAAIGAIAGGKKGALIGAGAGAAAGTGAAAATGKQDVELPAETGMVFTLQKPLEIRS